MSIRNRLVLCLGAVGATTLLATALVVHADDKAAPPSQAEQDAMMKAWQEFATPGEAHAGFAKRAGMWEATIEDFTSGQTMTSKGTCNRTMIFEGKYMQEEFESDFMGMPFKGLGYLGYDNNAKQYFYFWLDNMGTGYALSHGKHEEGNKSEMMGYSSGPMGKMNMRSVITMPDDNTDTFEMYSDMGMGGDPKLCMRITYKRKS